MGSAAFISIRVRHRRFRMDRRRAAWTTGVTRRNLSPMPDREGAIRSLSPAKALAILGYGESVAAYRYRTLADKAPTLALRAAFEEMADEEQGHHHFVQELIARYYPGADFVLTDQDKALVAVGSRQLNLSGPGAFARAIETICATERTTGDFYARLSENPPHPELRPVFREMADECFEHAQRVEALVREITAD